MLCAKGLGNIEDFNAGTGKTPSYFKEYDKLSQDIEKLQNFGQTVADYTNAVGRGIRKGLRESNGNLYTGLPINAVTKICFKSRIN